MQDDDEYDLEYETQGEPNIRRRALILRCLIEAAYGADRTEIVAWLEAQELIESVAPSELAFFEAKKPKEQQVINASWRTEALEAIMWALGELPTMTPSSDSASLASITEAMPEFLEDCNDFLNSETMRDESAIYDECEKIHDQHWSIRDAQINKKPIPNGLDSGVVREKHYALNWILYSEPWDEVETDT